MMGEAARRDRQQCEELADVAARAVEGWLDFTGGSGELCEKHQNSTGTEKQCGGPIRELRLA